VDPARRSGLAGFHRLAGGFDVTITMPGPQGAGHLFVDRLFHVTSARRMRAEFCQEMSK
jgi:hypothetical protein